MATLNYGDTSAWVLLYSTYGGNTYNVYLKSEEIPVIGFTDPSAIFLDYPDRGHFGFTLNSEKITVKISKIYAVTKAKWDELKAGLLMLRASTEDILLRIQTTATLYESFDGQGTTKGNLMPVLITGVKGQKKKYRGNTTVYEIAQISLQQSGDLTDTA